MEPSTDTGTPAPPPKIIELYNLGRQLNELEWHTQIGVFLGKTARAKEMQPTLSAELAPQLLSPVLDKMAPYIHESKVEAYHGFKMHIQQWFQSIFTSSDSGGDWSSQIGNQIVDQIIENNFLLMEEKYHFECDLLTFPAAREGYCNNIWADGCSPSVKEMLDELRGYLDQGVTANDLSVIGFGILVDRGVRPSPAYRYMYDQAQIGDIPVIYERCPSWKLCADEELMLDNLDCVLEQCQEERRNDASNYLFIDNTYESNCEPKIPKKESLIANICPKEQVPDLIYAQHVEKAWRSLVLSGLPVARLRQLKKAVIKDYPIYEKALEFLLSNIHLDILVILCHLNAYTLANKRSASAIVDSSKQEWATAIMKRVWTDENAIKPRAAELTAWGVVKAVEGSGGGYWIPEEMRALVEKWVKSHVDAIRSGKK